MQRRLSGLVGQQCNSRVYGSSRNTAMFGRTMRPQRRVSVPSTTGMEKRRPVAAVGQDNEVRLLCREQLGNPETSITSKACSTMVAGYEDYC